MNNTKSIGLCFFGLSQKDLAIFKRVIEFIEKKGKKFHQCSAESAELFIVNDEPVAIKEAQEQQQSQIIITISDSETCSIGSYIIKRPLLITRVMRSMDKASQLCGRPSTNRTQEAKSAEKKVIKKTITERGDFHALVVDDSAAIRKQLELELRGTNISADYAVCGKDALEKINKTQYDLIFLDIIMPDIYGYEVCKQLRKKKNYKRTPVIMLSGKTEPLDEVEGIIAGATTYLLKPVKHQNFQKTLNRISRWLHDYA
ncbi:MAG: response regulator [Cocleimonas sp.]|nr:response regulator [Cocleimonas sp.]